MQVTVRPGDTFWYYSQLFMIPFHLLIDSNPNIDPNRVKIGQSVNIPGFIREAYTVKKNDSLWKLANSRNISVDALILMNQRTNPNQLQIGETIFLPKRVISPIVEGKVAYDFALLTEHINQLKEVYPFIRIQTIGTSVLGKPIQEIRLGRGNKKVHFNAAFHANEWITTPILMSMLNTFLLSLTNSVPIRGLYTLPLYEQVNLSIVPMVNPDGVDLVINGPTEQLREQVIEMNQGSTDFSRWKANIRGVDLNKQFPANWEIEKERNVKVPNFRDFPGENPLTEPESVAMANLARENLFDRLIALHTQGKEIYWGYEGFEPPESQFLANEFQRVSGYQAIQYIDSHAGFKDWYIQEFRKPGFTVELGMGVNPLPLTQFDEIYEEILGIFLTSMYL